MTLYDLATVIRSKNAGPFTLTIDLLFANEADMDNVLRAAPFSAPAIAALYGVSADEVAIHVLRQAYAIKVTLPRAVSSGHPLDRDVYGSQQHFPLADMCLEPHDSPA